MEVWKPQLAQTVYLLPAKTGVGGCEQVPQQHWNTLHFLK